MGGLHLLDSNGSVTGAFNDPTNTFVEFQLFATRPPSHEIYEIPSGPIGFTGWFNAFNERFKERFNKR